MDIQKSTVSEVTFIRYEVTLTYRVVVEAPSDVHAVMDARYIVEQNAYDDGPPEPVVTVMANRPAEKMHQGDVDAVRAARAVYNAPCVNCGEPHRKHPNPRCAMWVGSSAGAASTRSGGQS